MAFPLGLGGADAIAMVRNRTGQTAGQPVDTVIQSFLNDALQYVERRIGAIWANNSIAITQGSDSVVLPQDLQTIINANFSITLPTTSNAVLYPIQLVQEGAFERLVGYAPGQSSGYPTLAFVQTDSAGVMTLQIYPVVQTNGFINVYYQQRPQQYADTTNASTTTLDPMFQEAMIVQTCKRVCENRGQYGRPIEYWDKVFGVVLQEIIEDAQRRTNPGRAMVADVMETMSNVPIWYSLPGE